MSLNDADKQWLQKEIRDAVNQHADQLFRLADHGGTAPTASPPNHPHNLKAILDRLDAIERRWVQLPCRTGCAAKRSFGRASTP